MLLPQITSGNNRSMASSQSADNNNDIEMDDGNELKELRREVLALRETEKEQAETTASLLTELQRRCDNIIELEVRKPFSRTGLRRRRWKFRLSPLSLLTMCLPCTDSQFSRGRHETSYITLFSVEVKYRKSLENTKTFSPQKEQVVAGKYAAAVHQSPL